MPGLKNVVAGDDDDQTGQRRRQNRQHKAHFDAAQGGLVGKQAGDRALPHLIGAPGGEILVVLGAEEVYQGPVGEVQFFHADGSVGLEGEDNDHHHGSHVNDKQDIGIDVGQCVPYGVGDLLLLQPGLGFGHGQVVALSLVSGQHGQQDDGEQGQDDGQQGGPGLGEGLVRSGRAGQTDDLRVDRVVTQQGGGGHGTQAGDEGHHRQGEHSGHQGGEDHLPQYFKGLGTHVSGGLYRVIVDAADCVAQKQGVVAGTGEGHGKQHRIEAGEPAGVELGKGVSQGGGKDAVGGVEEQIARDQRDAGVDHSGHIPQAQDAGAPDVEIFCKQHNGYAHHVDRDDQTDGQLQGVPHIPAHVARKEEADDGQGVPLSCGVGHIEDTGQGVQAGQQHKAEEEVGKGCDADHLYHKGRVKAAAVHGSVHYSTSAGAL